jgi:hypothetical protein
VGILNYVDHRSDYIYRSDYVYRSDCCAMPIFVRLSLSHMVLCLKFRCELAQVWRSAVCRGMFDLCFLYVVALHHGAWPFLASLYLGVGIQG